MPFLSATCVEHGAIAQAGVCCDGLTPWSYDANTGQAYNGFGCFNATCAQVGQFAGAGGLNSGKCCAGLVMVAGKCAAAPTGGSTGGSTGGGSTSSQCIKKAGETFICGIPDMWLYGGGAALLLLLMMGGKKR